MRLLRVRETRKSTDGGRVSHGVYLPRYPSTRLTMQQNYAIPVAIVLAGALIAGAVYLAYQGSTSATTQKETGDVSAMRPVGLDDHIVGNPDAPVVIVEYSDFECPFCKGFHSTVQQIINEYGKDGKVAWVYRHFPLDQLHSKARKEAVAAERANELGGNDAFWKYANRFFELTPSNDQTDIATVLPKIAREIGLDEAKFSSCLSSGKYDSRIQSDLDNAIASGGQGTPFSIVLVEGQDPTPVSGALPYEQMKQLIEAALQAAK